MKLTEEDLLYPADAPTLDDPHWSAEWLVTNALGGYASGTVSGLSTRRYHGFLIAALPAPWGRTMMLNELYEQVELSDGKVYHLGANEEPVRLDSASIPITPRFRLELGLPVWSYQTEQFELERRLWMVHDYNTTYIRYRLLGGENVRLRLRPAVNIRSHDAPVSEPLGDAYSLKISENRYEISARADLTPLRLQVLGRGGEFTIARRRLEQLAYITEANRGYPAVGELWMPGAFTTDLNNGSSATLVASTESWESIGALTPDEALSAEIVRRRRMLEIADQQLARGFGQQMVLAADQFLITPAGRVEDATRARAAGDEIRTVIAGYHWFTDWGRDTMISLEGLTLSTGRKVEASYILRTFAHAIRDGLIPNLFPEGSRGGLYHTADATLWFFHALDRYITLTGDYEMLISVMPNLLEIMRHHIDGTHFGIGVDHSDGLLKQGKEGYQLTWMDAKVEDWVVTPRRGKAVEINALWYNALCLMQAWCSEQNQPEREKEFCILANRVRDSFNRRFWYSDGGYLYDVVDSEAGTDDVAFRPNQIFAISLKNPVLDRSRWEPVITKVQEQLLTPVGLRSLAPNCKDYRSRYDGDLRSRDAAYHQGTVWAWLIGPFIDAYLKLYPDRRQTAAGFLDGFKDHLSQACLGSINEIFDAEAPYTPRGCIAQAWSVAEVVRSLVNTSGG